MAKKSTYPQFDESTYRAEQDMRTLVDAETIRADRKRLAAATKCAREKAEEMEKAFNTKEK